MHRAARVAARRDNNQLYIVHLQCCRRLKISYRIYVVEFRALNITLYIKYRLSFF